MLRNLWYAARHFKGRHARHGHMAELEDGERESGEEPPIGIGVSCRAEPVQTAPL